MASCKVFSLKEIDSIINADDFFDSDGEENEDIDDDILDDEEPSDVPGMIEVHRSAAEDRVVVLDPSSNTGAAASLATS